ncbi:MAG TPA: hypothetical protein VGB30_09135 [bacterium]
MKEKVERVLVIDAAWIHSLYDERGFIPGVKSEFLSELPSRAFFMDRPDAEKDPSYRQVIPYVLVCHEGKYLTVTRHKTQGEARLHEKMSIGIGGHINPIDGKPEDLLDSALKRELSEELAVDDPPGFDDLPALGLILSDNNEVSRVHLGVVMRWDVESPVSIRETDKMDGDYLEPDKISGVYERLENWSMLVYDGAVRTGVNSNLRR